MKKIIVSLLIFFFFCPLATQAVGLKATYPRLANYFLKWEINDFEAKELAKWDLIILDMEVQENSREQLLKIRKLNPKIIILAYINAVEQVNDVENYNSADLRMRLAENILDTWWLKDSGGKRISNWPYNSMLNLTEAAPLDTHGRRFNDYLVDFVVNEIQASGLWDGIYYDNTWGDISWLNQGNIDFNGDGLRDEASSADQAWVVGFRKVLTKTRQLTGKDFIIVGNGRVFAGYQSLLNGMMLEGFPSAWENGGTWVGSMKTYLQAPSLNVNPNTSIINVFNKNQIDYRRFRFGLTSALLGDGFYSFDYDVTDHGQTWWYDEYDVTLGPAKSSAYNLLANKGTEIKAGLWRRDFKYGSAIVNSTNKEQLYVFLKEEMEKIKGIQDPIFNNGAKINYLKLAPQDGVVLWRHSTDITNSAFTNGYFYRLYNFSGQQVRSGFFPYLDNFPGEQEIIIAGQETDSQDVNLNAGLGQVNLQRNGTKVASFFPYSKNYKGLVNLAAKIDQGYIRQVITGTTNGGGPQVGIFSPTGKLLGSFFAYDKNSRGGVAVALGDIDGDKQDEIITGPGPGLEPIIKVFTLKGVLKNSFLAYDKKFRGGISVAIGDVNGDGKNEVVTAPGIGGGPHIRIFNGQGEVLSSFFAYDKTYHGGVKVSLSDINNDGQIEILTGIKNFY